MSRDNKQSASGPGRRDILKGLGMAGAAAMAVASTEPADAQQSPPERESRDERTKARYQANSADVQAFYRTNRY